jgi:hypothetical protein
VGALSVAGLTTGREEGPGRPITREGKLTYLERFSVPLQLLVNDAQTEVDLVNLLKVCCSESGDHDATSELKCDYAKGHTRALRTFIHSKNAGEGFLCMVK